MWTCSTSSSFRTLPGTDHEDSVHAASVSVRSYVPFSCCFRELSFLLSSIPLALKLFSPALPQSTLNPEGRDSMKASYLGLSVINF